MVVIYFLILSVHEVLHLVFVIVLGGQGSLNLVQWKSQVSGLSTWGLHVEVNSLSSSARSVVNFIGPAGGAAIAYVLERNSASLPIGLGFRANVRVSIFYAAAETIASVLPLPTIPFQVISSPEVNYGVPLAIGIMTLRGAR